MPLFTITELLERVHAGTYAGSSPLDSRFLGRTGALLPILGLGGEVVFSHGSDAEAEEVFMTAIQSGVRYIDTAHDYANSQERLGRFFRNVPNVPLFVATKSGDRTRNGFLRELDENIRLLGRTPDLMHVHNVTKGEMADILADDGPLAAAVMARDAGLCRFVGVTSHDDPDTVCEIVRRCDEIDVVMVALSAADTRFADALLPMCAARGIGVVAMKVMGRGQLVRQEFGVTSGTQALRFSLSHPVSLAIVGFWNQQEVRELAMAVDGFMPMTAGEMRRLEDAVVPYAQDMWFYRSDIDNWTESAKRAEKWTSRRTNLAV